MADEITKVNPEETKSWIASAWKRDNKYVWAAIAIVFSLAGWSAPDELNLPDVSKLFTVNCPCTNCEKSADENKPVVDVPSIKVRVEH